MTGHLDYDPNRGRWYPWVFVAAFIVVIAVNGVMVSLAVGSFTGLETEHPYERGLNYNDMLAAARAQEALGWQVEYEALPAGEASDGVLPVVLTSRFLDKNGRPLTGLDVKAFLLRPTAQGYDLQVELQEAGGGRYSADAVLPLAGQWDLRIVATTTASPTVRSWQSSRRIVVQ